MLKKFEVVRTMWVFAERVIYLIAKEKQYLQLVYNFEYSGMMFIEWY